MEMLQKTGNLTDGNVASREQLQFKLSTKSVEYLNSSSGWNTTDLGNLSHSLKEVELDFFINTNLPAFCFLLILCVVGTCGNILTILVYTLVKEMKDLSACILIVWLSSVDLLLSVVCMPFELYIIYYSYTFTHDGACKFFKYLTHALAFMSILLLLTVARQRYQKAYNSVHGYTSRLAFLSKLICAQLKSQSSKFKYNCVCLVILFISFSFTIPLTVFLGIEEFDFLRTSGMECYVLKQYRGIMHAGLYGGLIILIGFICFAICCYSYGRIILLMHRQSKLKKQRNKPTNINLKTFKDPPNTHNEERVENCDVNTQNQTPKDQNPFEKGILLTKSLIFASFVSLLGFILYVIGAAFVVTNPEFEKSIRIITAGLIRAHFINNAVNPVAYLLFDRKFRSAVKKLYSHSLTAAK